jgi:hypothetical protein
MEKERKNNTKIGITGLKQICLVTKDLELAERRWSQILGIPAEHLVTPVWTEVPSYTDGKPDHFHEKFILFRLENDVLLEIYGPGESPDNPWRRYLEQYGEGVMNIAFYVPDNRADAYRQIGKATGIAQPYHEGFYPSCTYSFVGTRDQLGVELNIKCEEDNGELIQTLNNNPNTYQN